MFLKVEPLMNDPAPLPLLNLRSTNLLHDYYTPTVIDVLGWTTGVSTEAVATGLSWGLATMADSRATPSTTASARVAASTTACPPTAARRSPSTNGSTSAIQNLQMLESH